MYFLCTLNLAVWRHQFGHGSLARKGDKAWIWPIPIPGLYRP